MKAKFFYNVMLNIGIVLMILSGVSSFNQSNYPVFGISLLVVLILIYLKVKLFQQIKAKYPKK